MLRPIDESLYQSARLKHIQTEFLYELGLASKQLCYAAIDARGAAQKELLVRARLIGRIEGSISRGREERPIRLRKRAAH